MVNGAQLFYSKQFGIDDENDPRQMWLLGLVNSAPYLCCAVLGCWITVPLNNRFGRKGTIFVTCSISAMACLWQAFTNSWYVSGAWGFKSDYDTGGICLLLDSFLVLALVPSQQRCPCMQLK